MSDRRASRDDESRRTLSQPRGLPNESLEDRSESELYISLGILRFKRHHHRVLLRSSRPCRSRSDGLRRVFLSCWKSLHRRS